MRKLALLKTIALAIVAIYIISRGLPVLRAKQAASPPMEAPATLSGTVQKVLRDTRYTYVLIENAAGSHWIGSRSTAPQVGQVVSCHVERFVDAYESKTLNMAFERVYFTEELSVT